MKFLIFDREENYIGNLKDVLEAKQTEEINGEDVLELAVLEQKVENFSDEWRGNLILNSTDYSNLIKIYGVKGSVSIENYDGSPHGEVWHLSNIERTAGNYVWYIPLKSVAPEFTDFGADYTLSFWMKANSEQYLTVAVNFGNVRTYSDRQVDTKYKRFEIVISPRSDGANYNTHIILSGNNLTDVYVYGVKLEKGTIATPWTPAPEDLDIKPQDTIEKGYKLVYKDKYGYWKEYIVKEIEESHTSDGIEKRLFCESSFYETFGDYIEDKRPNGTASHALSVALGPTRWEVGIVDDLGINSTNFYHISSKEAVQKVAETWKGEIRTRVIVSGNKITHRYVDLLAQRGQNLGKRFTYTKDLESVTKTVHRDDVITALYGYGKGEEVGDGYGRRIDFADINNGKAYVENLEAKEIWGRNNSDGTKSHVFGKVEFDDCEDPKELLELTKEKLEEVSHPLVTYEAKVIDLGGADLGDNVAVIDKEFTPELRLKARVVKIVRDLLEEENNDITLGNFIPNIADTLNEQQKYIDNFRGKQGIWDRSQIINQDGTINAQFLNDLVDELNKRMNSTGGYVYLTEDGKGLITYDKPADQNPTMAIQLLGGAFRIANSKLPNGEWNWRTFGDGNGFVADAFIGGLLQGGKVKFDLTNGTLLIGDSISDYTLLWDGSHLKIQGGSFTIGGTSGNTTEITNGYGKWLHEDGSYTKISSQGLMRYDSGIGKQYHYMTKIIKFTAGGDNQSPSTKWIPIGAEFNNKQWSAALSISDSMTASSSQAAIHRIVLTQSVDENGNTIQPRYRNGQWEFPVMGYKTNVNAVEDTRRYGPVAGIMIVTA